jgi:hypothetical protein
VTAYFKGAEIMSDYIFVGDKDSELHFFGGEQKICFRF